MQWLSSNGSCLLQLVPRCLIVVLLSPYACLPPELHRSWRIYASDLRQIYGVNSSSLRAGCQIGPLRALSDPGLLGRFAPVADTQGFAPRPLLLNVTDL